MSFSLTTLWQSTVQNPEPLLKTHSRSPHFNRDHKISFGSGQTIHASSAPEYHGNACLVNPEETLLASLSSCHMLTFLALAHKKRLTVSHYEDSASAELGTNADGKTYVAHIHLCPRVIFSHGVEVDDNTLTKMHEKAHQHCFIANSIVAKVKVSPQT